MVFCQTSTWISHKYIVFLWPSHIPLFMCATSSSSTNLSVDTGCFHILAIGNDATMNTGVHMFLLSSEKYPEVELFNCIVVLFLIFWGNSMLFYIVAMSIYNPTNSLHGFSFLHILTDIFCLLNNSHSDRHKMISHCGLIWIPLRVMNVFSCVCWTFIYILWENVYSCLLPLFNCVLCLFCVVWVLCIFWILNPYQISFANIF